jgi:hypothetical protein
MYLLFHAAQFPWLSWVWGEQPPAAGRIAAGQDPDPQDSAGCPGNELNIWNHGSTEIECGWSVGDALRYEVIFQITLLKKEKIA